MRQITAAYLNLCTRSPPFKVHSLPRGGFLQVAVSEAPSQDHATADCSAVGASDTALRLPGTDPVGAHLDYFRIAEDPGATVGWLGSECRRGQFYA